jgi:flagellar biosynthesis protein FlhF
MKSFIAADMRSALRMVREALGEDAVILSNRRVPQGIELVAAADMPPLPPRAELAAEPESVTGYAAVDPYANAQRARQTQSGGDAGWGQMQQELRAMRDMIEQQYSNFSWQQFRTQQPAQAAMWRRLQRLGLSGEIVRELIEKPRANAEGNAGKSANEAWQQLMAELSADIPVCDGDLIAQGGVFAFVGPTGAGKTTTIGKLAARYVLDHGNADIALITTDSYRIGAHEQLRTLSRILNVPCKFVSGQRDLAAVLYEVRHCKLVLIDTAGLNARAPEFARQMAQLEALGDGVQCIQVLAANSQQQALQTAHKMYRTENMAGCIFTKLDEAGSLGECISLLLDSGLPLAYLADGQDIPGALTIGTGKALVTQAIALAKQNESNEAELAQVFARRG